jgi:hypothetical protein
MRADGIACRAEDLDDPLLVLVTTPGNYWKPGRIHTLVATLYTLE